VISAAINGLYFVHISGM